MKATRKIHKFDFSGDDAHVALVDQAANLTEVLVMKQASAQHDVTLSMPMKEFLVKFFGMWEEDATVLAKVMGYEANVYDGTVKENGNYMSLDEVIQHKADSITLLKGADLDKPISSDLANKLEVFYKEYGEKINTPVISTGETKLEKDSSMELSKEQIEDLQKSAARAEEQSKQIEELLKASKDATAQVELLKASAVAKATSEMATLVKGYSFVAEDAQEALVKSLMSVEDNSILLATLEKALDAVDAAVLDVEKGTSAAADKGTGAGSEDALEKSKNDAVTALLKSRNS